ncbi:MAG: glycosyltransferase family 4 protein [Clostridiaceae bacterium]|nr:glycosyltransferase family 4 protein [Clostridiaceae bacterium]
MKKVLFIIPFLSSGGAERVVSIWTTELAKLGSDVHLLVFHRVQNEYPIDKNVKIHTIKETKKAYSDLTRIQKILELRERIKHIEPDVILPFISHVGLMTTIATIGLPLKVVQTIRNDPRYNPRNRLIRWLRNLSVVLAKRCIVQNEQQKFYFPRWLQKRLVIFPNPVSSEFIQNPKVYLKEEIKNIVAVGRLEYQKNHKMLINTFSKLASDNKKIKLRIYGEGSLYTELNNLIKSKKLHDRILLCGRTTDMRQVLLDSDLFVLSSNFEGMPNSLLEAMAVGLPCISTNCPGSCDIIKDEINGKLVPVGDEEALGISIKSMIEHTGSAIKMGEKARETILSNYIAEVSAEKLFKFIESI